MSTPWYQYPITQAHGINGEQGVDYGVPFHTPLTALLPGVVQRVLCNVGWRCEVDVSSTYQGQPVTESFLHVDQPAVQVGSVVNVGSLIGLSGGQLQGGSNPDSAQFSSGPHTEFDIFRGAAWQNPIDPTSFVASFGTGGPSGSSSSNPIDSIPVVGGLVQAGVIAPGLDTIVGAGQQAVQSGQAGLASIGLGIASLPTSIGHGLADALGAGVHDFNVFAQRQIIALAVAVVVLLVLFLR